MREQLHDGLSLFGPSGSRKYLRSYISNRIPAHIHGVCFNDNHCSLSENRTRML